ncbi:vanadium-dependent haloperoxidase [Candidatus Dependentiae bacterium]|nr:vanadium-dependent haloperoxidase [Candidatus Dependentiae bacterium]
MIQRFFLMFLIVVGTQLLVHIGFFKQASAQFKRYTSVRRSELFPKKSATKPHPDRALDTIHYKKSSPFFAAHFTKGLEHDPITGLLTLNGQKNYKSLLKALSTGKRADFSAITYKGSQTFINPQGAFLPLLGSTDISAFKIPSFPQLSTPEAAALLLELYAMALCRDISFHEYGSGKGPDANGKGGSVTTDVATYLQALGELYTGPRNDQGVVDASVLFKWVPSGSLKGPYISQFLLLPLNTILYSTFPSGLHLSSLPKDPFIMQDQKRPIMCPYRDFAVSFEDFIALQNGEIPVPYSRLDYDPTAKRYISTGRDLASCVHFDHPYEPFYNALTILAELGFPSKKENFYSLSWALVAGVSVEALKASWVQKWRVSQVLRPEAFAGLVHIAVTQGVNPCNLHSSFFVPHAGIDLLDLTKHYNRRQGAATYLLSQTYPEGSSLHPSYPQAHATIAGACITVIKAFFDNEVKIAAHVVPVKPDPCDATKLISLKNEGEKDMTVASELDKLACNIGAGRNFAGIHYRADLEQGLRLGEKVALTYLQQQIALQCGPDFKGFILTTFDGVKVCVTSDTVKPVIRTHTDTPKTKSNS